MSEIFYRLETRISRIGPFKYYEDDSELPIADIPIKEKVHTIGVFMIPIKDIFPQFRKNIHKCAFINKESLYCYFETLLPVLPKNWVISTYEVHDDFYTSNISTQAIFNPRKAKRIKIETL